MERHIALTVAAFSLAAVAIAIMLPGRPVDPNPKVPWRIEVNADGSSSVLGITLGHTTLGEAEDQFEEVSELTCSSPRTRASVLRPISNGYSLPDCGRTW